MMSKAFHFAKGKIEWYTRWGHNVLSLNSECLLYTELDGRLESKLATLLTANK